ncbi:MAG: HAD-IIIA family hydrolase [Fibromonadaceae bacterium]|jgi:3-deoxy-D-manno-octulosonate 8-phosphate phosphatase (KDO 8-P phosphatase)|nr:HAD-IIIA family hydrolase [Fibromonadaceae bacterium]
MIKFLVLDIDGTLTDGKLYISANGEFMKAFDVKDGHGIAKILPELGITPIVVTGRESEIVKRRMAELGVVEVYQSVTDKELKLRELANKYACDLQDFGCVGDELTDIPAMQICGFSACPADAANEVKAVCNYVSTKNGGEGAAREIIEFLRDEIYNKR